MAAIERRFTPPHPIDLKLTLGPLRRGTGDPCTRIGDAGVWRATRTPDGPVSEHLRSDGDQIIMRAWGQGASWALEHAPTLVGCDDDTGDFQPEHSVIANLHRLYQGLRIPRSLAVVEAAVCTILEQKVQGVMARRSYWGLVRRYGERAPGPPGDAGLRLPPAPSFLAQLPSYAFHRFDVERKRADTIRVACAVRRRLEETSALPPEAARSRMTAVPGIGAWTAAQVALVALGDADAVSVGDYHLPNLVSWALAGEPRGDDARMLELLEPYLGHRGRVLRLLSLGVGKAPAHGPRLPLHPLAHL